MRVVIIGLSILTLSACGAAGSETGTQDAVGPCGNIQPILNARSEGEPFGSLQGANKMMGDTPLPDTFIGMHKAFGAACTASVMDGFGAGSTIYTYSCPLFEGNSMGRDAERADAEAAFAMAASEMRACLGEAWETAEDTENGDYQVYHKFTYKPVAMADSASGFTVDPAFLEMSYTPFMRGRGGPSGWQVVLQFQAQIDAPAEE
ncbi:hypothetical protein [Hyphomonas jannaschiana]|uniref:Lipoprotein n=1 Tax=Hyphomonas jannaschiana VP2 TaxID=1280952 RepID=A0A059FG35_9PROT|nr:hypothetical protein [Hyphomonas jannaschiana]KCZ89579.1 hypothetical protein HJA_04987 [Hyphomonas jannaschiana VP2]